MIDAGRRILWKLSQNLKVTGESVSKHILNIKEYNGRQEAYREFFRI
jgi:DNA-binding CsgD family transcriptional regulator